MSAVAGRPASAGSNAAERRASCKEQGGLFHLGLGDHPPVHDTDPVLLSRQLGSGGDPPRHRCRVLGRGGLLLRQSRRGKEDREDRAGENHSQSVWPFIGLN